MKNIEIKNVRVSIVEEEKLRNRNLYYSKLKLLLKETLKQKIFKDEDTIFFFGCERKIKDIVEEVLEILDDLEGYYVKIKVSFEKDNILQELKKSKNTLNKVLVDMVDGLEIIHTHIKEEKTQLGVELKQYFSYAVGNIARLDIAFGQYFGDEYYKQGLVLK